MGRIEKIKRQLIEEANKRVLNEVVTGIIGKNDRDWCLIKCNIKHAKNGSSGDIVKFIQFVLGNNDFNPKYEGGGMNDNCSQKWQYCDGKFRNHTKDAVKEFQSKYKLSVDGIVGPDTLNKMCEVLRNTDLFTINAADSGMCKKCQCDDIKKDQKRGVGEPIGDLPKAGDIIDDIEIVDIVDKVSDKQCGSIVKCIRYVSFEYPGLISTNNKWEQFLNCIKKIKGLPPITFPDKRKGKCTGCPKYVWGGYQRAGGGPEYWAKKGFEDKCLKNKCSIFTKNEKLYTDWVKNKTK